MSLAAFIVSVVTALAVGAQVTTMSGSPNYETAIVEANTAKLNSGDRRLELTQCIRAWESFERARSVVAAERDRLKTANARTIVVEIGNSAFGRYSYVVTGDEVIKVGKTGVSLSGDTTKQIASLFSDAWNYHNNGSETDPKSISHDGNCYFVSLFDGHTERSYALYGLRGKDPVRGLVRLLMPFVVKGDVD
jgi:hypothetical protein